MSSSFQSPTADNEIDPTSLSSLSLVDPQHQEHDQELLPDAIWRYILTFFHPRDLCCMALLNHDFYNWANDDALWKEHCLARWQGKQSIGRMLRRHQEHNNRNNNDHRTLTWKQWFGWAEYDKTRPIISQDEMCDYAWKLIYNGAESRMGLRKFLPNGTYHSPYAGLCEWALMDNRLCFMGLQLPVTRNLETWGWIIGPGTATVYHSVLEDANNGQAPIQELVESISNGNRA